MRCHRAAAPDVTISILWYSRRVRRPKSRVRGQRYSRLSRSPLRQLSLPRENPRDRRGDRGFGPLFFRRGSVANRNVGAHRIDWPAMVLPTLAWLTPTFSADCGEAAAIARIIARSGMFRPGLVIFDCDGVLVDSELIDARYAASAFEPKGLT